MFGIAASLTLSALSADDVVAYPIKRQRKQFAELPMVFFFPLLTSLC